MRVSQGRSSLAQGLTSVGVLKLPYVVSMVLESGVLYSLDLVYSMTLVCWNQIWCVVLNGFGMFTSQVYCLRSAVFWE